MKKHILITGVSGYLGTRLREALSRRKDVETIVGIDIRKPEKPLKGMTFYQTDIRDPQLYAIMAEHEIHTVIHLAFVVEPIHNRKRMHDIDFNGTENVLKAAAESGVSHFIAVSSTLAYGARPDNPEKLTEDHPLNGNPAFPYAHEKARTDRMIQEFADAHPEMTVTILRPCTVFGPNVDNYISRLLFLPATVCIRGCNPPVQFVHEKDFVAACVLAVGKPLAGAFNIAGDGTLTIRQIAKHLGTRVIPMPAFVIYPLLEVLWRMRAPRIEVNRGYLDYIRFPFVASNNKAKTELGFNPKYSSRKTLDETIRSRHNARAEKKRAAFRLFNRA